jgi:hypothetical protein
MSENESELGKIESRLKSLETRVSMLESALTASDKSIQVNSNEKIQQPVSVGTIEEESGLESQIGRFGLAWLGNIVLLFGIAFLAQYLMNLGMGAFGVLLGYIASGSIFFLSNYLKKTNSHLAFMFKMNAQVLLFYITLKLHFFTVVPLLSNKAISLILLLLVVAYQAYTAIRDKSQAFALLSILFVLTTAIVSDAAYVILPLVFIAAGGSIYYYYRFGWEPLLIIAIIFTYLTGFLWLLGNPVISHAMQLVKQPGSGVIYFFGLGAFYSITLLFRNSDKSLDDFLTGVTFVNGIFFTFLLVFIVLGFFSKNYVPLFSVITVCCLTYSVILHSRCNWNFASAFYSLYGFMAMSIALYGLLGLPEVYLLLAVQSLVVVSMALWFRNRLIVVMNSLLFLSILLVYILSSKYVNGVNFSFALIPLVSARIVNWKKSRLQIKTDLIRNLYMIEGFIMVLFALIHAIPRQFITLSWTIAALLYFVVSLILKNVKYRYMALGTMIAAAIYLFLIDLARIEIIYRVLALLFLAAISIGISMYYSSRIKKSDN